MASSLTHLGQHWKDEVFIERSEVVFNMQVVTFYEDDSFPYMQWFMNILKGQSNEILGF